VTAPTRTPEADDPNIETTPAADVTAAANGTATAELTATTGETAATDGTATTDEIVTVTVEGTATPELTGTPPPHTSREPRRIRLLARLGLRPSTQEVVARFLDEGLPSGDGVALDAGCGRLSQLVPFRSRIGRFVGVDIHTPAKPLEWLDEFAVADLCSDIEAFPRASFDLALSSFTVEHFADPPGAFRTIAAWLRPGGWLVITTVNRAHPFVNAYLSLPPWLGRPLQRVVKATTADAHPLVGVCNTPADVRRALQDTGYVDIEIVTTDHLARAWGRRLPTYVVGLIGDLAAHRLPGRRSTIVVRARRPDAAA
jgi:SAM-dependent methyltransferase